MLTHWSYVFLALTHRYTLFCKDISVRFHIFVSWTFYIHFDSPKVRVSCNQSAPKPGQVSRNDGFNTGSLVITLREYVIYHMILVIRMWRTARKISHFGISKLNISSEKNEKCVTTNCVVRKGKSSRRPSLIIQYNWYVDIIMVIEFNSIINTIHGNKAL